MDFCHHSVADAPTMTLLGVISFTKPPRCMFRYVVSTYPPFLLARSSLHTVPARHTQYKMLTLVFYQGQGACSLTCCVPWNVLHAPSGPGRSVTVREGSLPHWDPQMLTAVPIKPVILPQANFTCPQLFCPLIILAPLVSAFVSPAPLTSSIPSTSATLAVATLGVPSLGVSTLGYWLMVSPSLALVRPMCPWRRLLGACRNGIGCSRCNSLIPRVQDTPCTMDCGTLCSTVVGCHQPK